MHAAITVVPDFFAAVALHAAPELFRSQDAPGQLAAAIQQGLLGHRSLAA